MKIAKRLSKQDRATIEDVVENKGVWDDTFLLWVFPDGSRGYLLNDRFVETL